MFRLTLVQSDGERVDYGVFESHEDAIRRTLECVEMWGDELALGLGDRFEISPC